jgi:DNA-binding beta-propeller fold protein YncE
MACEEQEEKAVRDRVRAVTSLTFAFMALSSLAPQGASGRAEPPYEVWMLDQSNTHDADGNGVLDSGGTLYIFDGRQLAGRAVSRIRPEVIPLGGELADEVREATGSAPVRPHYITFNASHTHAIVSFVASGHVLIFDASTRTPVFVVDVGTQAHAAVPSPDQSFILVANQNGKLLQRINTDYATNSFTLDAAATLNLATGTTPSGALKQDDGVVQVNVRPDNAPILALPDADSRLAFVTLRGGGFFVVNPRASPMEIVGEYTRATIDPAGLLAIQRGDKLYFNSGGGGGATLGFQSILYRLPVSAFSTTPNLTPDSPPPVVEFDHGDREVNDSHGLLLTKHERYLWVADRAANRVIVVDTASDAVVNEIELSGAVSEDPAPDLIGISPSGNRVFTTLRGPNPLTGNNAMLNNAQGHSPGLGIIRVEAGGGGGTLQAAFPVSNPDASGVEHADPHGLAVRIR